MIAWPLGLGLFLSRKFGLKWGLFAVLACLAAELTVLVWPVLREGPTA